MKFDWSLPPYHTFNLVEKSFAESYAKDPYQAFFYAFLMKMTIAGRLSIKIDAGKILPSPNLEAAFESEVIRSIASPSFPIISEGNNYFLHRFYTAYRHCLERLADFSKGSDIDHFRLETLYQQYKEENLLNEEQLEAVYQAVQFPFFMLTGGPGTGKTFTAARLLNALWHCLHEHKRERFTCAVVAPTGKAANHLLGSLKKGIKEEELQKRLTAKTLHALLRYNPNKTEDEVEPIFYDLVLVDEASMIDVELMAALCRKLKKQARLILIGDPYQLPPVEGPGIFPVLLKEDFKQVALKTCLRVESSDLIDLSHAIRLGENLRESANVKLLDMSLTEFIEKFQDKFLSLAEGYQQLQKFCILTPIKKGPFGAATLNARFHEALMRKKMLKVPLLLTANDYTLDLFNGELGLLEHEEVLFANERKVPLSLIKEYELGFAMTIHKSQGSEFEEVVLILPPADEGYSKELIYTAVTRAKKQLYILRPL